MGGTLTLVGSFLAVFVPALGLFVCVWWLAQVAD
jgi:hypothetical protein